MEKFEYNWLFSDLSNTAESARKIMENFEMRDSKKSEIAKIKLIEDFLNIGMEILDLIE